MGYETPSQTTASGGQPGHLRSGRLVCDRRHRGGLAGALAGIALTPAALNTEIARKSLNDISCTAQRGGFSR